MKNKIFILSGATATGKTELSLKIADKINGVIVNFDSLLLYQELNIGTAKPSKNEQKNIPHYMIDVASIKSPMNAASYREMALPKINELLKENKPIILTGGSGFYLQALLNGMYSSPTTPDEILKKSNQLYQDQGITPFVEVLKLHDPKSLRIYHINDHYRIRRATEHWWANNTCFSEIKDQHKNQSNPWNTYHCNIDIPKDQHWEIILNRTQKMTKDGLIDEVLNLLKIGFRGDEKPLQSIGYKEVIEHIKGELTLEECVELISISTRQLAKSQRTWFKKVDAHKYNSLLDFDQIIQEGIRFFKDQE